MGLSTKTRKTKKIIPARVLTLIPGALVYDEAGLIRTVHHCDPPKVRFKDRPYLSNLGNVSGIPLTPEVLQTLRNDTYIYKVSDGVGFMEKSGYTLHYQPMAGVWLIAGTQHGYFKYVHELQYFHLFAQCETLTMEQRIIKYDKR